MDGYTEMLAVHKTVLLQLFEMQTLNPVVEEIRVFNLMLGCVSQLRDLYSDYFLGLVDRRRILKTIELTNTRFTSITEVCVK